MQRLDGENNLTVEDLECASLLIETMMLGMRTVKANLASLKPYDLSIPQFRLLRFLSGHDGVSLSDLAEHLELALPSMSRAVEGLVRRGLVLRDTAPDDRRRVTLSLSQSGHEAFQSAWESTRCCIAGILSGLVGQQRSRIAAAMQDLQSVLQPDSPVQRGQ